MQPLEKIGEYCQENDVFFVVVSVATYGGSPVKVDEWGIDIAIAGSQKCVGVPLGMSLITYNQRVEKVLPAVTKRIGTQQRFQKRKAHQQQLS